VHFEEFVFNIKDVDFSSFLELYAFFTGYLFSFFDTFGYLFSFLRYLVLIFNFCFGKA